MNSLITKRKKYTFQVDLKVEELVHVPFVNEELYVKLRLLKGGFTNNSKSLMVKTHSVRWDETFKFSCKMTASASTGELDTCICRVSVRQEVRGGRSYQKLGFVNVNLAQFAGCGGSQSYLLEGYNSRHRLFNSMLKVYVFMILSAGDICFKAQPFPRPLHAAGNEGTLENTENHLPRPPSLSGSVTSIGYSSLDKKVKANDKESQEEIEQTGHSRNSSNTSGSGYVSNASHSDKSATHVRACIPDDRKPRPRIRAMIENQRRLRNCQSFADLSNPPSPKTPLGKRSSSILNFLPNFPICSRLSAPSSPLCNDVFETPISVACLKETVLYLDTLSPSPVVMRERIRTASQGSADLYSEDGSLERPSSRLQPASHSDCNKDKRVVETRINASEMIDQIFEVTLGTGKLDEPVNTLGSGKLDEAIETSGLQLFLKEDGTASVRGHKLPSTSEFKPIIVPKR